MNRNRSVSSSPDPLGGTPRTTTQSTNPDLARSPTPQNSDDDPNSPQEENGTSNNSSIPSTRTDSIPVAREISLGAETEDGEDSRESPSFEGVKFSSSLDHNLNSADSPQRLATSRIHSPDDNPSPGRARGLEKDRPEVHDQPTRTRTKAPTAASSLHRPGSSSSRNIQSSQMPSTTLASKTTHLLSRNKTTSVMNPRLPGGKGTQQPRVQASSQAMQHRREPPPRSRSARVEDRLATRTVVPPRGLALPGPIPKIDAPLGKAPYHSSSIRKDLGSAEVGSSSSSPGLIRRKPNTNALSLPITRSSQSSARNNNQEEEEEDSIEALRNTGPIRSSRKDDLRFESRAYIYGLPGSSTLFGSDFSKASLAEDGEDAGGFDLGEESGMHIGVIHGSERGSEDGNGAGDDLTRRRRDESGGENTSELTRDTETSSQGVRTSISRPLSIVSAGQEASALIPDAMTLQRLRAGRPQQDGLQLVSTSSPRSVSVPSTSQVFAADSCKPQSTQAPISDQHASEQNIEHRTISTRRAPRRIPSVVYKPRARRNSIEREIQLSSSEQEEQELPSLEELDLPSASLLQHRTKVPKKRNIQALESEESEEERPKRLATKKRRAAQKKNTGKPTRREADERTESERKNAEARLKRIKEIDDYELEVDYVV